MPQQPATLPHLRMIRIKGGIFRMGSDSEEAYEDEKTVHNVTLSDFELGAFPVTQALWEAVMGATNNPSTFSGPLRPVKQVSWFDAAAFCNRLNQQLQLPYCYFSDPEHGVPYALEGDLPNEGPVFYRPAIGSYRLPTEAEWEYAARGGHHDTPTEYAGSDQLREIAWFGENSSSETHPVGLLQPNALGLFDMSGNVWEWCYDWYGAYEPEDGQINPFGPPEGEVRVVRGGSWFDNNLRLLRVSNRYYFHPDLRLNDVGFRLARHLTL